MPEFQNEGSDASGFWREFKIIRNKINNRRKYEEKIFKKEALKKSIGSAADTWRISKQFMGWKENSGPPLQLSINGQLITKALDIANAMNTFFMKKITDIQRAINYVPNSFVACINLMRHNKCQLSLQHVTRQRVNSLIKKLKNTKSSSIDKLDSYAIRIAADEITDPLHHIITLSILQQKFPTSWKSAG